MRVSALGFDIDHTLGVDNKLERVVFLRLLDAICAGGGTYLGTLTQESARIDDLLAQQRAGSFSIGQAVERFAAEHGAQAPAAYVDRYKRMALESVPEFFVPLPDARAVVAELQRRGVACAILSNGWSPLQQEKASRLDFSGPVLVSELIGTQKPQRKAFAALARALETEPASVAFVGDNPRDDVAAAMSAGMRGIWLDAEDVTYPPELAAPSAVIHRLTELLTLL
ncbi:MAG TPA: HAD family hydrolase [Candidatus Rubrimentiphilum sp.]|nr:HAD family hydrolase [Candidatus Rubrimentiphilum sp.]